MDTAVGTSYSEGLGSLAARLHMVNLDCYVVGIRRKVKFRASVGRGL